MTYKIRRIEANDNKDIQALNVRLGYTYSEEKVHDRILNILETGTDIILVVEVEGKVVGYIHGCPYNTLYADTLFSIVAVVFAEKWLTHLDMYNDLMSAFEEKVRKNGYSGIRMSADAQRNRLYDFMLENGYENKRDLKHYIKYL